MQDWYLMGNSPIYNNGFETDEFVSYAIDGFSELLHDSPLSSKVDICNSDLTVIKTICAIVQNNTAESKLKSTERQILTNIGILETGQYIRYKNRIFLITSLVDDNKFYEKGIMSICNYSINFQNTEGKTFSYPAIFTNTNRIGVENSKLISHSIQQYAVQLKLDNETKLLKIGKRFLCDIDTIEPSAYKIEGRDVLTNNYINEGTVTITLVASEFDPNKDNKELMIADYFEPKDSPSSNDLIIQYAGETELKSGGRFKSFSVTSTDIVTWSLIATEYQLSKIIQEIEGNTIKLKVDDESLIGTSIKLKANALENTGEVLIKITSIF